MYPLYSFTLRSMVIKHSAKLVERWRRGLAAFFDAKFWCDERH
jgi:hypothetical protein